MSAKEISFDLDQDMELTPVKRNLPPAYIIYPLEEMPVGSSFFVPNTTKAPLTVSQHVRAFRKAKAEALGIDVADLSMTFKSRKREENGVAGIRVWKMSE